MLKNIWLSFKEKSFIYKALLVIFALVFTKSIFIFPFSLIQGVAGAALGLLLWAVIFLLLNAAVYYSSKLKWQYEDTKVKKHKILLYMLPTLIVSTFLLMTFFPGVMSWDSMYIWESTIDNDYSSLHPITYVLFVDALNNIVDSPWLVIAVQYTYAAFVFAYAVYTFETMGLNKKICWAVSVILAVYPIHALNHVAMLKDVPYMISLILISVIMLKMIKKENLTILYCIALFAAGTVALYSRHNGLFTIPVIFAAAAIFFVKKKQYINLIKSLLTIALIIISFYVSNNLIIDALGENYWERSSSSDIWMMPTAQLCYTVDKNWDTMTEAQQQKAETYLDMDYIEYQKEKYSNWNFNIRYLESQNVDNINQDRVGFAKFYIEMCISYPSDMITEYLQATGIVWATKEYGYTLLRNTGIPENYIDIGLSSDYMFPKLAEFLENNPETVFWLRPALYLMLTLLSFFIAKRKSRPEAFIVASPMLANALGFLFGTPAQNVRYLYCNFTIFIITALFVFMNGKKKEEPYPAKEA